MRYGRIALIVTVAAALTAGCAQSKVDPDAQVVVRGALTLPDGSPAAHIEVGLMRVPDVGEVFFQGLVVAGTFGTACLSKRPPPVCKTIQTTKTDADGRYVFRMRGDDVQGMFGEASYFQLGAVAHRRSGERAAPSIDASFQIQRTELTVPRMRFWRPDDLSAGAGSAQVDVAWSGPHGKPTSADQVHFSVAGAGAAEVWHQEAAPGDQVDARAVEDMSGTFHVTAYRELPGPDTTFDITYGSQRVGFHGAAGAPASRGSECAVRDGKGMNQLDTCPLTDGSYTKSFPPQGCDGASSPSPSAARCPANTSTQLDLGTAKPVTAVFSHSLALSSGDPVVETSDDGEHWTWRGKLDPVEYGKLALHGVTARYVRLRTTGEGATIDRLNELSIWTG